MKTTYSILVSTVLGLAVLTTSFTSEKEPGVLKSKTLPVSSFSFFRTHHQGSGITATWGLTSEQGISGFIVERTYEDPMDPYAQWDCVCASPCNGTRSYKTTDLNVSPGFITYRVTAYFQFGGSMMSDNSTEHVVSH